MADFLLFDPPTMHRPSYFHPSASGSYSGSADFDNALFYSSNYTSQPSSASHPYGLNQHQYRRRESASLPSSFSSTPTQPSFFATYYANNHPDLADLCDEEDEVNNDPGMPGLSPSNPGGNLDPVSLRDPFTANQSDSMDYSHDKSKSLPDCSSDNEFELLSREYLRFPADPLYSPSSFKNAKLERTISDVLEDELYSPNMSPVQSTASDDFLLDFADSLPHSWSVKSLPVTRTASPSASGRDMSPFRKSSPYYSVPPPDSPLLHSNSQYNLFPPSSAPSPALPSQPNFQRVQQASDNLRAMSSSPQPVSLQSKFVPGQQKSLQQQLQHLQLQKQQQQQRANTSIRQTQQTQLMDQTQAKTISPKEALLDYTEGEENMSSTDPPPQPRLFAPTPGSSSSGSMIKSEAEFDSGDESYADFELFTKSSYPRSHNQFDDAQSSNQYDDFGTPTQSSTVPSPSASDYEDSSGIVSPASSVASKHLGRSFQVERGLEMSSPPVRTADGSEVYLCPDCGKTFPKPQNLQLHWRTHSLTPPRKKIPLSAQTGPHRCTWTNPSTGRPCNKIFSRPYDLIRHQETIHAMNRRTFRCELCGDDTKTFSRQDALARHIRVKHEKGK